MMLVENTKKSVKLLYSVYNVNHSQHDISERLSLNMVIVVHHL